MKQRILAALTSAGAGSMRFRIDEHNANRAAFFRTAAFDIKK